MNKKNIISTLLAIIILIPVIGIIIFRVVDSYYGFKYTDAVVGPILDPLVEKYPYAVLIIGGIYLSYRIVSVAIKADKALKGKKEN